MLKLTGKISYTILRSQFLLIFTYVFTLFLCHVMSVNNELLAIYYICEDWTGALQVYCSDVSADLDAN